MSLENRENYGFTGPMDMSLLPQSIVDLFKDSYDLPSNFNFSSQFISNQTSLNRGQIPKAFWGFINELGNKWTQNHINTGIKSLNENIDDITPDHYPFSGKMIKEAIECLSLNKNSKVLVAGSVSPWIECICLNYGFETIITSDYQIKKIEDPRIKFVHANDILNYKFDLIISFSSIEHDGLGRYGDPINPYGPFNATDEFYNSLNCNGKLICGVPVFTKNIQTPSVIHGNFHIIFSQKSINKLFRRFTMLKTIYIPDLTGLANWQDQPVFILNKN